MCRRFFLVFCVLSLYASMNPAPAISSSIPPDSSSLFLEVVDHHIPVAAIQVTITSISSDADLFYNTTGGTGWNGWTPIILDDGSSTFGFGLSSGRLLDFAVFDGSSYYYLQDAKLTFKDTNSDGFNDYLKVSWTGVGTFSFDIVNLPCGQEIKQVPIPAAGILFGSGLLGMMGIGLKRKRKTLAQ
jgi:hypothetical protein